MDADFIAENLPQYIAWRHHLHSNPELSNQEHKTSDFIATRLDEFGLSYTRLGLGLVAQLGTAAAGAASPIGLRADIDALPIRESNGFAHKSKNEGVMHACGHDGHTTMLLGAAHYAAQHQDEIGRQVYLIFQPAEELGGGAAAMIDAGLFEDFEIEEIYGMHNWPNLPVGEFVVLDGPIMAAIASFDLVISGGGGHAAMPQLLADTMLVAANIQVQLQSVVSRTIDPCESLVLSWTAIAAGDSYNVVPAEVRLKGCMRYFTEAVRERALGQIHKIIEANCSPYGLSYNLEVQNDAPPTINHPAQTAVARAAAQQVAGANKVITECNPSMASEDFAYMLQEKPGCYLWLGNGSSANLHHPSYDFNDATLEHGIKYWLSLMRAAA